MDSGLITIVEWVLRLFRAYAIAGLIFAVPFVVLWVKRVDSAAQGWAIGFRTLIIPGVAVFWPLLAIRLLRGKRQPTEQNSHRKAAQHSGGVA